MVRHAPNLELRAADCGMEVECKLTQSLLNPITAWFVANLFR